MSHSQPNDTLALHCYCFYWWKWDQGEEHTVILSPSKQTIHTQQKERWQSHEDSCIPSTLKRNKMLLLLKKGIFCREHFKTMTKKSWWEGIIDTPAQQLSFKDTKLFWIYLLFKDFCPDISLMQSAWGWILLEWWITWGKSIYCWLHRTF